MKKYCQFCGLEFQTDLKIQIYCSRTCVSKQAYKKSQIKLQKQRDQKQIDFIAQFGFTENIVSFPIKNGGFEE